MTSDLTTGQGARGDTENAEDLADDVETADGAAEFGELRRAGDWRRGVRLFGERGLTWPRPGGPRERRPPLRERLAPPMPAEPWWIGWGGPLLITLIAGFMRFWKLGIPHAIVFDETYYPKDAWTIWQYGYEYQWQDPLKYANPALLRNPPTVLLCHAYNTKNGCTTVGAEYVVHPPAGKYIMGIGERIFGLNPFGWRFIVALMGTLAVLMLARVVRRMTRSTLLGCVAGILLSFDGLEFVMSRTGILDNMVMFWALAGFGCLVVDRDRVRERLVDWRESMGEGPLDDDERGPKLGWRPWRILAGLCLGIGMATKWNDGWALAGFSVMTVLWDRGARRAVGLRRPSRSTIRRDLGPTILSLPILGAAVYVVSWSGWFFTSGGFYRQWANTNPPAGFGWIPGFARHTLASWVPNPVRSWWFYENQVFQFNANLSSPHPYESNPWTWLLMGRPVSFYYESPTYGQSGCTVKQCSSAILALGTPPLWWVGTAGLIFALWRWIFRRDWRAGAVLAGMASLWLPWLHYSARTIFEFYAVSFVPFMVISATLVVGALLGREDASPTRRMWGAVGAGVIVLSVVGAFMWFYPLYSAHVIPYDSWNARMWFTSWI